MRVMQTIVLASLSIFFISALVSCSGSPSSSTSKPVEAKPGEVEKLLAQLNDTDLDVRLSAMQQLARFRSDKNKIVPVVADLIQKRVMNTMSYSARK